MIRLIDLNAVETHKQLEPNGNGDYEEVEVVYKDDLENLETWTPEEVTLWYLTHHDITRIYDNRKGYEKTYKLVQHGSWEKTSPLTDTIVCSNCGYNWPSEEMKSKYCPECGAEMREEQ